MPTELDALLAAASGGGDALAAAEKANDDGDDADGAAGPSNCDGQSGTADGGRGALKAGSRAKRNREQARVSNAKRKGRVKEMENGLERTRQQVAQLEESVRALEAENHDLRAMLTN